MNRRGIGTIAGVVALGLMIAGLTQLSAQREPPPPGPGGPPGPVGRYQLVRITKQDQIILLDTVTGDLYLAEPENVKSYRDRPRPGSSKEKGFKEKADGFEEKDIRKEKAPRFERKDKSDSKDKE